METMKQRAFKIVALGQDDPYITIGAGVTNSNEYWSFGRDNLFPQAIAILNRRSTVHRGILNSKSRYISGKAITCDEKDKGLIDWIKNCNAFGDNLRNVVQKFEFDYLSDGNGYLEIVTNAKRSFLNIYHQDHTRCRLSKDKKYVLLHHDWRNVKGSANKKRQIPIYPVFEDTLKDGYLRSIIHLKDYEPEFENYGLPGWIAGLNVSAIAYKTDKWNISRLDNSFNSSGVLVVSGEFKTDEEYEDFQTDFNENFTGEGKQGKILMLAQQPGQQPDAGTKFIPITQAAEGDWQNLHLQSTDDLIIAHSWFRALSGITDNTGFDTQRILNEYEIALNTVILDEQENILSIIRKILNDVLRVDGSTLSFVNRPPATSKPPYMKLWEARKADGMDYNETDPAQQIYLANITSKTTLTLTP